MEGVNISEMGWNSFMSSTMPTIEESELMAQLLAGCEQDEEMSFSIPSLFYSDFGTDQYSNYLAASQTNYWPQESFNFSASSLFGLPNIDESMDIAGLAMNYCNTDDRQVVLTGCFGSQKETSSHEDLGDSAMMNSVEPVAGFDQKRMVHKRKFSIDEVSMNIDYYDNKLDANVDDSKKKGHKGIKKPKEALNLNGKIRSTRGSATHPQSLYARKRRERINERLRILQNLVPNGTKVDISTMLEEAVQYVKFLQLQIKLLSSDELWMYAPLAYNGMGIGL